MAGFSNIGISSNIDFNALIDASVAAEEIPVKNRLDKKEIDITLEIEAVSKFKGALSDFQTALETLTDHDSYTKRKISNSNTDLFTATADADSQFGTYTVEVTQLAQPHKIKSSVFNSLTDTVGSGTLTIYHGTYESGPDTFTINPKRDTTIIAIDSDHSTVQGVMDTINNADAGVTASVINDGSGYHLVISDVESGTANSIKILVDDDDGTDTDTSGLSQLAYDPTATAGSGKNLTETLEAKDALLKVDGLDVTVSSNKVTDVIPGVTLDLLETDVGKPSTLKIELDTLQLTATVGTFVGGFNNLLDTLNDLSFYNVDTKESGKLNGDATLRSVEAQLREYVISAVPGLRPVIDTSTETHYVSVSMLGITTDATTGKLKVDDEKLQDVISEDYKAIEKIFNAVGDPDDTFINYVSSTDATAVQDYVVNITQMATRGTYAGDGAAVLTIVADTNDTLSFDIDGYSSTITLSAQTYTASELAAEIQARVNGSKTFSEQGIEVAVTESSGVLTVTSERYGSASKVEVTGGTAKTDLFGASPTQTDGVDVAGTIGGVEATGSGRYLTGAGDAAGLKLEIIGGATGDRGRVYFSRGVGAIAAEYLNAFLDKEYDPLGQRNEGLNEEIKRITEQRKTLQTRLEKMRERLVAQYTALDQLISKLNSTGNFLSQQLANMPAITNRAKK